MIKVLPFQSCKFRCAGISGACRCQWCNTDFTYSDNIYDLIKDPPPAAWNEVTRWYEYYEGEGRRKDA
jgi:hypothetical protein